MTISTVDKKMMKLAIEEALVSTEKGGYRQENAVFYLKKENGCKK